MAWFGYGMARHGIVGLWYGMVGVWYGMAW